MVKSKITSLLTICMLLVQFFIPTHVFAANQDVSESLNIASNKIFINNKEYEQGTVVKKGDKLQIEVYWSIPDTTGIKDGDFIYIPIKVNGVDIQTTTETSYSLKLEGSGTEIGRWGVIKKSEGNYLIKCIFNEQIESKASLKNGKFFAGGGVISDESVIVEVANDGSPIEIPVTEGGSSEIGIIHPSGDIEKWGWQNNTDINRINWEIGVNRLSFFNFLTGEISDIEAATKKNVLFIDELQKGQTVRSLSPWTAFPIVVEYGGELRPAGPYVTTSEYVGVHSFTKIEYQDGDTESTFKEKVRSTSAPCYGIFPKEKHTDEANSSDDGDYLYFNAGDLPGTLEANITISDFYSAIDSMDIPEAAKETTRDAYEKYFSALDKGATDYVPIMSPIIKFQTNVPEGTPSQNIRNTARIEYSNGDEISNENTLAYKDFEGTVGAVEKGNVRIIKKDKQSQTPIESVTFGLYKKSDNRLTLVDKKQTGVDGVVEFEKVGIGNFVILELESGTYDPNSLAVQDEKEQSIPINSYQVNGVDYKGFEFSLSGEESMGLKYSAENEKRIATTNLSVEKQLAGRNLQEGEFKFELKDSSGKTIQTKTNDSEGNIYFDELSYTEAGEYEYTITEVKGNDKNIIYDEAIYKVQVVVTEKDGQLTATAPRDEKPLFKNIYKKNEVLKKKESTHKKYPKTGSMKSKRLLVTGMLLLFVGAIISFCRFTKKWE